MSTVKLQVVGGGDAFGSGGQFNTCFYVTSAANNFLIDCGATSLVALKKSGVDIGSIDLILISHFHGDHFGGLPFILLNEQLVSKRIKPLTIAGPKGAKKHINSLLEAMFPQTSTLEWSFDLNIIELEAGVPTPVENIQVECLPVVHSPGSNPHGLRIGVDEKLIAFSGDSEWTDTISQLADGADLFIVECFTYDKPLANHLNYVTLLNKRAAINSERIVLTHMSDSMLNHNEPLEFEKIEDGKVYEL